MRTSRDVGIVGYGTYLPRCRISATEIEKVWMGATTDSAARAKTVPAPDEDAATIAVEAARNALEMAAVDPRDLGVVWVGSESKPYAVKPTATIVADAIGALPGANAADWEFACKAGTDAMQAGFGLVASGMARYALCVGADTAQAKPGDLLEYATGAGAAAYVLGPGEESLAVLEATSSYVTNTPDFFRREGQPYPRHAHRFTGTPAYFAHVRAAVGRLLAEVALGPEAFAAAVFHQPNADFPRRAARELGFRPEQFERYVLAGEVGNTYAASALLALAAALDDTDPPARILLASYGSGAGSDAFAFRVTELADERRGRGIPLASYLARREEIDYGLYARYVGRLR